MHFWPTQNWPVIAKWLKKKNSVSSAAHPPPQGRADLLAKDVEYVPVSRKTVACENLFEITILEDGATAMMHKVMMPCGTVMSVWCQRSDSTCTTRIKGHLMFSRDFLIAMAPIDLASKT